MGRLGYNRSVSFNNIVPTKVCSNCGKEFCLPVGANFDDYAYKEYKGRNYKFYCSWSCLQANRRKKAGTPVKSVVLEYDDGRRYYRWSEKRKADMQEKRRQQLAIILPLHKQGLSMRQIAQDTGINYNTVRCRLNEIGVRKNG